MMSLLNHCHSEKKVRENEYITIQDMSIASDIRRLLNRVSGITDIKIRKTKSEIELSLEEADKGIVTEWESVDDYFKTMLSK